MPITIIFFHLYFILFKYIFMPSSPCAEYNSNFLLKSQVYIKNGCYLHPFEFYFFLSIISFITVPKVAMFCISDGTIIFVDCPSANFSNAS